MNDRLLDTGILIRYLRKSPGYNHLLRDLGLKGRLQISTMTRLEVIRGMGEYERGETYKLLNTLISIPMDARIADFAGEMIMTWRKSGITLGDADTVIAATALDLGIPLVTTNPRHFPMPELSIWQADEAGNVHLFER
jgi:predicted nucleic acid-binding protein